MCQKERKLSKFRNDGTVALKNIVISLRMKPEEGIKHTSEHWTCVRVSDLFSLFLDKLFEKFIL